MKIFPKWSYIIYGWPLKIHSFSVFVLVYLRADLTILKERIKKRARVEEAHIEPGFLEGLQEYHDDW